ncbi:hypothetical protein N7486_004564 [Penicillium sp. IBT 16267x]|nr:hypothetical protein N7486_004564 [Penicillium sp. IBT 16267x]
MAFKLGLGDSSLAHSGHVVSFSGGIQSLTQVFISQSWILESSGAVRQRNGAGNSRYRWKEKVDLKKAIV